MQAKSTTYNPSYVQNSAPTYYQNPVVITPASENSIEEFSIRPGLLDAVFMLPFPFFCAGCWSCMSMTANFRFDNRAQILSLSVYPGFLCCKSKTYEIPYFEIQGFVISRVPKCKINKQPAYDVNLQTNSRSIKITGAKTQHEAMEDRNELERKSAKCRHIEQTY